MKILLFLFAASTFLFSCSKNEVKTDFKSASDYYPLVLGAWHVYDVDSISYDNFTDPVTIDSITYQVKEELTDTFYDLEGELSYEITRSKRSGNDSVNVESVNWVVSDIWWVKNNGGNIERIEENIRYITLLNPIKDGLVWDGNGFNFIESWDFTYEGIENSFSDYSNTVSVNQKYFNDKLYYRQNFKEVFAHGIGLVSRTRIDTESQNTQDVINKPEKGFQFFQTLNNYYIPE